MTEFRSIAHIALGANLDFDGHGPSKTLAMAIEALAKSEVEIRAVSRFFQTPCFPVNAGPDYVNAAISVHWTGSPQALLNILHAIEAQFGRARLQRWGMRTLDLDLLALGDLICPDITGFQDWLNMPVESQMQHAPDHLILPHPRLQDRAFVLVPLCDVAPDWVHPVLGRTIRQMLEQVPTAQLGEITPI